MTTPWYCVIRVSDLKLLYLGRDQFAAMQHAVDGTVCRFGESLGDAERSAAYEAGRQLSGHLESDCDEFRTSLRAAIWGRVKEGFGRLTARETEILTRLAEGQTSAICARTLGISASTVDNHKAKIMKKLKIHRLTELVRFAIHEGLIPDIVVQGRTKLG